MDMEKFKKMSEETCGVPFWKIEAGELKLNAHNAVKWVNISELDELILVPADIVVVEKIKDL